MTKEQWLAIRNADSACDGQFYYGLRTTKKFCRPSCRKKSYDPRRVLVFDTVEQALAMGYTPCARCRPDQPDWAGPKAELARAAERYIREHYAQKFSLDALAGAMHVDKSYLLRTFRAYAGVTPLAYHNRVRCEQAEQLLTRPELSISYIAATVGYASASHFSQVFQRVTGRTPSACRAAWLRSLDE